MLSAPSAGRMIFLVSVVALSGGRAGELRGVEGRSHRHGPFDRARELGSRNITANVVAPGFVDTDMTAALEDRYIEMAKQAIPLGRYGKPEEVAAVSASSPPTRPATSPVRSSRSTAAWAWVTDQPNQHHSTVRRRTNPWADCSTARHILITGIITDASIAFHAAAIAQEQGAKVLITGIPQRLRLIDRIAKRLPQQVPPAIELDVTDEEDLAALADRVRELAPEGVDGVLHSIAFAPPTLMGPRPSRSSTRPGRTRPRRSRSPRGVDASLARAVLPVMNEGGSIVGMDFDPRTAMPVLQLDGRGEGGAGVGEPVRRAGGRCGQADPLEPRRRRPDQDVGRQGDRRARPPTTRSNSTCSTSTGTAHRRSAGTSTTRRRWRSRSCALLSDWLPGTTGSIVYVDGGASPQHVVPGELSTACRLMPSIGPTSMPSLLSFGGPERPDDVMPFLENVTRGRGVPRGAARGGRAALLPLRWGVPDQRAEPRDHRRRWNAQLAAAGIDLPVYFGNRNWHPLVEDTVATMRDDGVADALVFATSAWAATRRAGSTTRTSRGPASAVGTGAAS